MNGYDLADEVYCNIGKNKNHEISLNDAIRVISFWGFNEEASRASKIGFVCYCARERIKKTFESTLVWDNFTLFDEMVKNIQGRKCEDNTRPHYSNEWTSEDSLYVEQGMLYD